MISTGTSKTVTTEPTPAPPKLRDYPDVLGNMLFCYECDDDAASSVVSDAHGANDAVLQELVGGAWPSLNTDEASTTGKVDKCFDLYNTIAPAQSRRVDFTTVEPGPGAYFDHDKSFSFATWVYYPAAPVMPDPAQIMGNWAAAGVGWFVQFTGGSIEFQVTDDGATYYKITSSAGLIPGNWFHIAISHDHTQPQTEDGMKVYINAADVSVKSGQAGNVGVFSNISESVFGVTPTAGGTNPWVGYLDQSISWTKVIDTSILSTVYNGSYGMAY
jgi:hypothetical protein